MSQGYRQEGCDIRCKVGVELCFGKGEGGVPNFYQIDHQGGILPQVDATIGAYTPNSF